MKYIVDTNFFLTAHLAHYPPDVVISFWKKVEELANAGKIFSIDKVRDEIFQKKDPLQAWCKTSLPSDFFCKSSECITEYAKVMSWASSQLGTKYNQSAIDQFANIKKADASLVSYVLSDPSNFTLVSYEVPKSGASKIKLPHPCKDFGLNYLSPLEMFREMKVQF